MFPLLASYTDSLEKKKATFTICCENKVGRGNYALYLDYQAEVKREEKRNYCPAFVSILMYLYTAFL